jgi:hypothetical protein
MAGSTPTRVVAVATSLTAVVSSGLAVLINLATDSPDSYWAWMGVVILTALGAGISLWQTLRSRRRAAEDSTITNSFDGTMNANNRGNGRSYQVGSGTMNVREVP